VVDGGRSGQHRLLRRWATADSVIRWCSSRPGGCPRANCSRRASSDVGEETDEFNSQPTTFIEDEGTSLKAALDIARKYGKRARFRLPFKTGHLYPTRRKTFYAIAAQYKIAQLFQSQHNLAT
jgi:hypothetical protein